MFFSGRIARLPSATLSCHRHPVGSTPADVRRGGSSLHSQSRSGLPFLLQLVAKAQMRPLGRGRTSETFGFRVFFSFASLEEFPAPSHSDQSIHSERNRGSQKHAQQNSTLVADKVISADARHTSAGHSIRRSPQGRIQYSTYSQEKGKATVKRPSLCVGATYFAGPLPAKYRQQR